MKIFDIVYDFVEGVVCVTIWVCLCQGLKIKGLLIHRDVALFAWDYVGSIHSHQSHASLEELRILALALFVPAEYHSPVLLSNSDEILDEVNIFEDRILLSSEHQSNEIIFLMQLLTTLILSAGGYDHCIFRLGRRLFFAILNRFPLVLPESAYFLSILPSFFVQYLLNLSVGQFLFLYPNHWWLSDSRSFLSALSVEV